MLEHPLQFAAIALFAGFALVAAAKIYGLFFMRWKTPFRLGSAMNVQHAEVTDWTEGPNGGKGFVSAGGELWRAISHDALKPGDPVIIVSTNGLTLSVKRKTG